MLDTKFGSRSFQGKAEANIPSVAVIVQRSSHADLLSHGLDPPVLCLGRGRMRRGRHLHLAGVAGETVGAAVKARQKVLWRHKERERERETDRQTDRQRERESAMLRSTCVKLKSWETVIKVLQPLSYLPV